MDLTVCYSDLEFAANVQLVIAVDIELVHSQDELLGLHVETDHRVVR